MITIFVNRWPQIMSIIPRLTPYVSNTQTVTHTYCQYVCEIVLRQTAELLRVHLEMVKKAERNFARAYAVTTADDSVGLM